MKNLIKAIFDDHYKQIPAGRALARDLRAYRQRFIFSRQENAEFLGAALVGTPKFVFTDEWRYKLLDDVLRLDDDTALLDDLTKIYEHNKTYEQKHSDQLSLDDRTNKQSPWVQLVNPTFKVASDVYNMSVIYVVHRLLTDKSLSSKDAYEASIALLQMMHYKFLGSLMHNYFKHEPKREVAENTYYSLSGKFGLKQAGSWEKLILKRCNDILDPDGIHLKRSILSFKFTHESLRMPSGETKGQGVGFVLSDTQGRLREVVKSIYPVFLACHASSADLTVNKDLFTDSEGEMKIKSLVREHTSIVNYIHDVAQHRDTFIKTELVDVVLDSVHTAPERHLRATLDYIVENYGMNGDKLVKPFIDVVMLHSFDYLNKQPDNPGMRTILSDLKAKYTSSRSQDANLLTIRELGEGIVKKATAVGSHSMLASLRTAVALYIVFRAFTRKYYQS